MTWQNVEWMDDAACQGAPLGVFFPIQINGHSYRSARMFCASCPVMVACRAWNDQMERGALSNRQVYGFIGGESPEDRIRRRRHEPRLASRDLTCLYEEIMQHFATRNEAAAAFAARFGIAKVSALRLFERVKRGEVIGYRNTDRLRIFNVS